MQILSTNALLPKAIPMRINVSLPTCFLIFCISGYSSAEDPPLYDVVIYGNTAAAVSAAIQARRMGKWAIIVGPDKHLGGLSSGGLGWTDSGNKGVIGGISREFYQRVKKYYDDPSAWNWQKQDEYSRYRPKDDAQWTFEPRVAEKVFNDLVRENSILVHPDQWLERAPGKGVEMKNGRIASIKMTSGAVYHGKMFIDATYEGDLLAAAGVSYTVGRESNEKYNETLNGVQTINARKHQFEGNISAYKIPGDPSSGLLPRISPDPPGKEGAGDKKVQAYNFRMCVTREPENRVPFPKPEGYDVSQYELLLRDLNAGSRHVKGKFDMLPNLKTDTNNHGSFSTDNIGMNYDYPEASYQRRREIIQEHRTYQQGYCYFLANDPRVPEEVREWYSQWGLAKDEFVDNGHWPHQIYVREARRMVGDLVVNENHLKLSIPTERSIGMGSYNMDSHNVQRYVDAEGFVRNEGDVQINPGGPYPIDYGAIIPKRAECENLLVTCAVSSSHIAYGSIRMEPVFMILGQSAMTAAAIALDKGVAVQDVEYEVLQKRLLADRQVLTYDGPRRKPRKAGIDPAKLPGIVIDDVDAKREGHWKESTSVGGFVGKSYLHDDNANKGECSIRFEVPVKQTGSYDIRIALTANPNRATNVPVTIQSSGLSISKSINQRETPPIDEAWVSLGKHDFTAGDTVSVTVSNAGTKGHVVVDAVQLISQ